MADGQNYKEGFHVGLSVVLVFVVVVVLFGCYLGVSLNEENYFDAMGYVGPTYFVLEGQQRKQERKSHNVRMIFKVY